MYLFDYFYRNCVITRLLVYVKVLSTNYLENNYGKEYVIEYGLGSQEEDGQKIEICFFYLLFNLVYV